VDVGIGVEVSRGEDDGVGEGSGEG
jgi:hypothetical protein